MRARKANAPPHDDDGRPDLQALVTLAGGYQNIDWRAWDEAVARWRQAHRDQLHREREINRRSRSTRAASHERAMTDLAAAPRNMKEMTMTKHDDQQEYDCPRCRGTGCYSLVCDDGNGINECCRACGSTGRMTDAQWHEWERCAYNMHGGLTEEERSKYPDRELDAEAEARKDYDLCRDWFEARSPPRND
jgi:hypothetical protein